MTILTRDAFTSLLAAGELPSVFERRAQLVEEHHEREAITDEDRARIRERFGEEAATGRVVRFVACTPGRKGDGIKILPEGFDFSRHDLNPRVLWSHNRWSPRIGDSVVWMGDDQVLREVVAFYPRDISPFSFMIGEMAGLRGHAVSIGFRVLEWAEPPEDEGAGPYAIDALHTLLMETSLVNIPMDENAIEEARAAGVDVEPAQVELARMLDELGLRGALERAWRAAAPKTSTQVDLGAAKVEDVVQLRPVARSELTAALRTLGDDL